MRVTQVAIDKPSANGDNCHGKPVIRDVISDLLSTPKRREVGDRVRENTIPLRGKPGRHPHHVLLGDTRIEKAIRKLLLEWFDYRVPQVSDHQDYAVILPRNLN
jgi:hypothetical protein